MPWQFLYIIVKGRHNVEPALWCWAALWWEQLWPCASQARDIDVSMRVQSGLAWTLVPAARKGEARRLCESDLGQCGRQVSENLCQQPK